MGRVRKHPVSDWNIKHQSIKELVEYVEQAAPSFTFDTHGYNVFFGAAGLTRCNRYLKAIDSAVESGLGDTAGGNLRILYETWVLGHLLLLADDEELAKLWGVSRGHADKVTKALDVVIDYPEGAPEAEEDKGIEQRARLLSNKLKELGDSEWSLPTTCYEMLFRSESFLSTHANISSVLSYADPSGKIPRELDVDDYQWRTLLGATIEEYFVLAILKAAGQETATLEKMVEPLSAGMGEIQKELSKDK